MDQLLGTARTPCPRRTTYTTKSELLAALLPEFKDALTAMHLEFMESLHDRVQTSMPEMVKPLQSKIQEFGDVQAGFADVAQGQFSEILKAAAECNDAMKDLQKTLKSMQDELVEKMQDLKGLLAEISGQNDDLLITATTTAGTANRLMRDFEAFNEAVKNSFQDLGVASGGFHDKLTAWFGGLESLKINLHELLLSIADKLKDAALEATMGRSLQSDARLHAINTYVVQMCTHMGLATNPEQPPAGVQGPPPKTKSVTDGTPAARRTSRRH